MKIPVESADICDTAVLEKSWSANWPKSVDRYVSMELDASRSVWTRLLTSRALGRALPSEATRGAWIPKEVHCLVCVIN